MFFGGYIYFFYFEKGEIKLKKAEKKVDLILEESGKVNPFNVVILINLQGRNPISINLVAFLTHWTSSFTGINSPYSSSETEIENLTGCGLYKTIFPSKIIK